jgi:hypothetical protein
MFFGRLASPDSMASLLFCGFSTTWGVCSSRVAIVLFPLLVMLAGAVCKANRNLLLRIFTPSLYISNLAVSALVIVQGVVLMGTTSYRYEPPSRAE